LQDTTNADLKEEVSRLGKNLKELLVTILARQSLSARIGRRGNKRVKGRSEMKQVVLGMVFVLVVLATGLVAAADPSGGILLLGTWNLRGYPETAPDRAQWFTTTLSDIGPDILCVQEIANQDRVDIFLAVEGFATAAFQDSSDGMDNAIFFANGIYVEDMPDPERFQHPAQEAYFRYRGLDAVLITVHLSWSDTAKRAAERQLLVGVVNSALERDPDVIVAGDFNTTGTPGDTISGLAAELGLEVLIPNNMGRVGTTYASDIHTYDYVLVSPDLYNEEALGSHICVFTHDDAQIARAVSDHRPVIAAFCTDLRYRDYKPQPQPGDDPGNDDSGVESPPGDDGESEGGVVINEVEMNPPGSDSGSEWVEIYNTSDKAIDLTEWQLSYTAYCSSGPLTCWESPLFGVVIPPRGRYVYTYSKMHLNNKNGWQIALRDSSGVIVDSTPQGLTDTNDNGSTWQRVSDGYDTDSYSDWTYQYSTQNAPNS
jgi:endonuclease/exonuclease/phosphatase family metal-dependent hydrolase